MMSENDDLEEECEDAVFQICCTRERYSVRCAYQLEKYLALVTKMKTAPVKEKSSPNFNFDIPLITEEQQELFRKLDQSNKVTNQQSDSNSDVKLILNRIKELTSILNQIERSNSNEVYQLLKE